MVFGEGEIPTPPGMQGEAMGLNENGEVVGYYSPNPAAEWRGFVYRNGVMDPLPTLGGDDSVGHAINDDGTIVGWARTTTDAYHATRWTGAGVTDLGTLGGDFSIGFDINMSGKVAGVSYTVPGASGHRAFLYDEGLLRDLGTVGAFWSAAEGINDEGLVVGHLSDTSGTPRAAFVWGDLDGDLEGDPGEIVDLNTLIPSSSGWNLQYAYAINSTGRIVGVGETPAGATHAYLLTPIPEPATLTLLALGGVAVISRARRLRVSVLLSAAIFVCIGTTALGNPAFFHGLGDLTDGSYYSTAYQVTGDGLIAVGRSSSHLPASDTEAFRWTSTNPNTGEGTMTGLGYLPSSPEAKWSEAYGVSADGSVVVGKSTSQRAQYWEAFCWNDADGNGQSDPGEMQPLFDPPDSQVYSMARAVSGDGAVVVGGVQHPTEPPKYWQTYRWVWNGQTWDMDLIPRSAGQPDLEMLARACSSDGSVVVGGPEPGRIGHLPFSWTDATGTVLLPDPTGGDIWAQARDISADGGVIVGRGISDWGEEACYWTQEQDAWIVHPLGDLPGGMFMSSANAVSADGAVIVGSGRTGPTESDQEAFIWDQAHGMRNLRDVLVNDYGLDLTGWVLLGANGISDDGMTVVGAGYHSDWPGREVEGFIAHIPEPASLGLVALGGAVMLNRRRGLGG